MSSSSSSGTGPLTHEKIDQLRVLELKALCLRHDLDDFGKKGVLVKRLKEYVEREQRREQVAKANLPLTPESLAPGECPAVIMGTAQTGSDETMIESAQLSLRSVLESEDLEIDRNIPQMAVGNRRGLGLAALPAEVSALKSNVAKLTHRLSIQETTIMSLQGQVTDLTMAAKSHRAVRQRFVAFYKRDKDPDTPLEDYDQACISEGNSTAHGGDAKADAELYRGFKPRVDFHIYKQLYGYQPETVWRIDHTPTLALMNVHATIKADLRREASGNFDAFFKEFVDRFEESNFNPTYLDYGNNTKVTEAYLRFRDCIPDEVKVLPPKE